MQEIPLEDVVQEHVYKKLKEWGKAPELEKTTPKGGRADIVTPDTVYEVKRTLTDEKIYQALGQGYSYAR